MFEYSNFFMRFDPYITDEEDLVEIVSACMRVFAGGGELLNNWSNEGTSVGKITKSDLTQELYEAAVLCLKLKNPAVYGYVHRKTRPLRGGGAYGA